MTPETLAAMRSKLERLEMVWAVLEERVEVLEDNTCSHEGRLEDLEEWQEKVDDILDADNSQCYR